MPFPTTTAIGGGVSNTTLAQNIPQYARGTTQLFEVDFFDDEPTNSTPTIPSNPAVSPNWSIISPTGTEIASGVAVGGSQVGRWQFNYSISPSDELSTRDGKYNVNWVMNSSTNRVIQKTTQFDVVELLTPDAPIDENSYGYITYAGNSERLVLSLPSTPDNLTISIYKASLSIGSGVPSEVAQETGTLVGGQITEVVEGTISKFIYDTSPLGVGEYQIVWNYNQVASSPTTTSVERLVTPPKVFWSLAPELRMLIDRLHKSIGTPHAFTESDLFEYLTQGIGIMNGVTPFTGWSWATLPFSPATRMYLLEAGALWALQAQHLLETELHFGFCLDEETLIRTNRGLVKAKDLGGVNRVKLGSSKLLREDQVSMLHKVVNKLEIVTGKRAENIAKLAKIPISGKQLGLLFSHIGSSYAKSSDHRGGWLWDIELIRNRLLDIGIFNKERPKTFSSNYNMYSVGEEKEPIHIWDMGVKNTFKVTTSLGSSEICTKDHGFLTLDTATFESKWKKLKNIKEGDYIAIDRTPDKKDSWEVTFDNDPITSLSTPTEKDYGYTIPTKLTPALARLLGYLVSEGTLTSRRRVSFCNTDDVLLEQYKKDFKECFGKHPVYTGETMSDTSTEPTYHLEGSGVKLRTFLASIGLGYTKSKTHEIPWCILQAPLDLVSEFIKTFIDGDGHVTDDQVLFCTHSPVLRNQIQALLLRFGIISTNRSKLVSVRFPSLAIYHEDIGFLHKGKVITDFGVKYPKIETIPVEMLQSIRDIRKFLDVDSKGWRTSKEGKKIRCKVSWEHSSKGSAKYGIVKYVTWNHIDKWWADRKEIVTEINPKLADRIEFLLQTQFQWVKVTSIVNEGRRNVLDPCLQDGDGLLAHGFTANGLINHNSGQTITLDVDRSAGYSEAITRMIEDLRGSGISNWPNVKKNLLRQQRPSAHVANRYMGRRYNQNLVYGMGRRSVNSTSSNGVFTLLTNLGLT